MRWIVFSFLLVKIKKDGCSGGRSFICLIPILRINAASLADRQSLDRKVKRGVLFFSEVEEPFFFKLTVAAAIVVVKWARSIELHVGLPSVGTSLGTIETAAVKQISHDFSVEFSGQVNWFDKVLCDRSDE